MNNNNENSALNKPVVNGRHKWDYLTDTCIKCGIERRRKPLRTKYTLIVKGMMNEYLVDGKWVETLPACR